MPTDRRTFLTGATAALGFKAATAASAPPRPDSMTRRPAAGARTASARVRAIVFDGFPIIDPRPLAARAEELFPGKGEALHGAWRTRQFEYTWLASERLCNGSPGLRSAARRDCILRIGRLGCRGREVVWIPHFLGQPHAAASRGAGHECGRDRLRSGGFRGFRFTL